jgi:type I restriction enzyme M protein
MLDARKVFRKVTTTINDFSPEQMQSLTAIVKAYRGDATQLQGTVETFIVNYLNKLSELQEQTNKWLQQYKEVISSVTSYNDKAVTKTFTNEAATENSTDEILKPMFKLCNEFSAKEKGINKGYVAQREMDKAFAATKDVRRDFRKHIDGAYRNVQNAYSKVVKEYELNKEKDWRQLKVKEELDQLETTKEAVHDALHETEYYHHAAEWLLKRFPEGKYTNVEGFCKVVTIEEVAGKEYSLSPGRYVGVDASDNEDKDWEEKLGAIHLELEELNNKAIQLAKSIQSNYKEVLR